MDYAIDLMKHIGNAGLQLLLQPYFYVAVLFLWWKYQKQVQQQRRLFQVKLVSALSLLGRTVGLGLLAAIVGSIGLYFLDVTLSTDVLVVLWVLAFVLMLFRIRYLCFAYAGGLLALAHLAFQFVSRPEVDMKGWSWLYSVISELDIASLLLVVGVMHVLEAVLMRYRGTKAATPLLMQSKRGKIIGAYAIQGFWPVPLLLPMDDGSFIAFPIIIGFAELTRSSLLRNKVRKTSRLLIGYGVVIAGLVVFAQYVYEPLLWAVAVLAIVLHEAINYYGRYLDGQRSPLYTHDNRGLRVLSVVPTSPAEQLGIVPGEIISRVNGVKVMTRAQLHEAFRMNSVYCKLEVINLEGELKFLKRAIYEGEHHQLGIILAPDDTTNVYVTPGDVPLRGMLGPSAGVSRLR